MIASFRMYEAGARAAIAWRRLFEAVFEMAGLSIRVVEHRWPVPIAALWAEPTLACGFMCGWPFWRSRPPMQPIAVPVPSLPRYAGEPRYCSEYLVRASSGLARLEETFGRRFGWMAADSQSGFNGPRAHLSTFVSAERPALYAEVLGPLGAPASTLGRLQTGDVDVVAIDSFYLDLCRRHAPELLDGLATVAQTPWAPIPLLVAAPGIEAEMVARLRAVLCQAREQATLAGLLDDCLVSRFESPQVERYATLEAMALRARAHGYESIR